MVETIGQMAGAPSRQQIGAWLASLSDQQVIDRMSQLKRTDTYEPDIMWHNMSVFEGMRDDASRFVSENLVDEV